MSTIGPNFLPASDSDSNDKAKEKQENDALETKVNDASTPALRRISSTEYGQLFTDEEIEKLESEPPEILVENITWQDESPPVNDTDCNIPPEFEDESNIDEAYQPVPGENNHNAEIGEDNKNIDLKGKEARKRILNEGFSNMKLDDLRNLNEDIESKLNPAKSKNALGRMRQIVKQVWLNIFTMRGQQLKEINKALVQEINNKEKVIFKEIFKPSAMDVIVYLRNHLGGVVPTTPGERIEFREKIWEHMPALQDSFKRLKRQSDSLTNNEVDKKALLSTDFQKEDLRIGDFKSFSKPEIDAFLEWLIDNPG